MNQSKKLFNLMAMLTVAAMFVLVGCDKNSTDPDNPADALIGTWKGTSLMVYYGSSVANADSSEDMTDEVGPDDVIIFNADGKTDVESVTYTATADEITFTDNTGSETEVIVVPYVLSDNTLTFTLHEEADAEYGRPETWNVVTYTKQ